MVGLPKRKFKRYDCGFEWELDSELGDQKNAQNANQKTFIDIFNEEEV